MNIGVFGEIGLIFDELVVILIFFFFLFCVYQECKVVEEVMKKYELEFDYFVFFLVQIGDLLYISKYEVYKLKEECFQDFKYCFIDKVNLIQVRFEKV